MSVPNLTESWPQWELQDFLRVSSYGKVYRAKSETDGKPVYAAIEIITVPPDQSSIDSARFQGIKEDTLRSYLDKFKDDLIWEMTMLKKVSSRHLVKIDDMITNENEQSPGWTGYIRTEVYTPLKTYFENNKLNQDEIVKMARDVYEALSAAGAYGMVHGDINPNNIFVSDTGSFLLGGFGVRRCVEKAWGAQSGGDFDAPEVYEEGKYSPQSDIFSLGMVMAYLLNGGCLPSGKNLSIINGADEQILEIIKKATAYDPNERFSSAVEMRAALDKLNDAGEGIPIATAIVVKEQPIVEETSEQTEAIPHKEAIFKKPRWIAIALVMILAALAVALLLTKPWEYLSSSGTENPISSVLPIENSTPEPSIPAGT